jgi:hypothetical protein
MPVGNFTIDFDGFFYSMDHNNGQLTIKDAGGTPGAPFILDTPIIEVQSLQFDGYYFWSLERQGTSGFRIRKWDANNGIASKIAEYSFISASTKYDVHAMCVEAYVDTLAGSANLGEYTFTVDDGQVIIPGDDVVIGPNALGKYSFNHVSDKVGNVITTSDSIQYQIEPGSTITFSRAFYVFSDRDASGAEAKLFAFRTDTGDFLLANGTNMYDGVRATTFFKNKIMFIKGGEIIWLSPANPGKIFRSQGISEFITTSGTYQQSYDLAGRSDIIYRLNREHLYYDDTFDRWEEHNWSPLFNYNESVITPYVFQVAVKVEPQVIHRYHVTVTGTLESDIVVTVLDQFRTPVFNEQVQFSTSGGGGSIFPLSAPTDTNGQVKAKYTASSAVGEIDIIATVGTP